MGLAPKPVPKMVTNSPGDTPPNAKLAAFTTPAAGKRDVAANRRFVGAAVYGSRLLRAREALQIVGRRHRHVPCARRGAAFEQVEIGAGGIRAQNVELRIGGEIVRARRGVDGPVPV